MFPMSSLSGRGKFHCSIFQKHVMAFQLANLMSQFPQVVVVFRFFFLFFSRIGSQDIEWLPEAPGYPALSAADRALS